MTADKLARKKTSTTSSSSRNNFGAKVSLAILCLVFVSLFAVCVGSVRIDLADIWNYLCQNITPSNDALVSGSTAIILGKVRIPRIVVAGLVGGALALIGAIMQGLFKNPMADPSVLGISSGAALGAAIVIVAGLEATILGLSGIYIGAILGAMASWLIVYTISRRIGNSDTNAVLLTGIAISSVTSALITVLMTLNLDSMEQVYMWMLGSFSNSTPSKSIILLIASVILVPPIVLFSSRIDVLKLGDDTATTLGINAAHMTRIMFLLCSILLAFCVANSGIIGFVGLIIPHCATFMRAYRARQKAILSFIMGATFTILCDIVARTIAAPSEVAIGAITSLIGAPYFIFLMLRSYKSRSRKISAQKAQTSVLFDEDQNINLANLLVRYEDKTILGPLSTKIRAGALTAILGPNGSGKSTLLKEIIAATAPHKDELSHIAYVAQENDGAIGLQVHDVVMLGRTTRALLHDAHKSEADLKIADESMSKLSITALADRSFDTLSGGEKQRVLLARAFAQQSPWLLLDEPTSSLDIAHTEQLMAILKNEFSDTNPASTKSALVVLHDINAALLYADDIILLKEGRIIYHGSAGSVTTDLLSETFGHKFTAANLDDGRRIVF